MKESAAWTSSTTTTFPASPAWRIARCRDRSAATRSWSIVPTTTEASRAVLRPRNHAVASTPGAAGSPSSQMHVGSAACADSQPAA